MSTRLMTPWQDIEIPTELRDEAKALREKMKTATGPELDALKKQFYDLVDTRKFCVVTANGGVRHCFQVANNAEAHLDQLKKEYYRSGPYSKLPDDEFHFFVGFHHAQEFMNL